MIRCASFIIAASLLGPLRSDILLRTSLTTRSSGDSGVASGSGSGAFTRGGVVAGSGAFTRGGVVSGVLARGGRFLL